MLEKEQFQKIIEYYESKVYPYKVDQFGAFKKLEKLGNKFQMEMILEGISIACEKYLMHDENYKFTTESVLDVLDKIGGICTNKNKPIIEQKKAILKIIASKRYQDIIPYEYSLFIDEYISVLQKNEWSENAIAYELEMEIKGIMNNTDNYESFKKYTSSRLFTIINNEQIEERNEDNLSQKVLAEEADNYYTKINQIIEAMKFLGFKFPDFEENKFMLCFLNELKEFLDLEIPEEINQYDFMITNSLKFFNYPDYVVETTGCIGVLRDTVKDYFEKIYEILKFRTRDYSERDTCILRDLVSEKLKNQIKIRMIE